jgi:hypothetical protein
VVPPDDDVIEHSPVGIQQVGVLRSPRFNFAKIVGQRVLDPICSLTIREPDGSEVRHIKHRARIAARKVLTDCALIFEWHLPTAKWRKARRCSIMNRVKW